MKNTSKFIISASIFTLLLVSFAQANIVRTLKLGSTGSDVKELQIMLNKDPETRIANTGVGSPGRESISFGTLTRKAVIKFQAKYADEVLYSGGLSFPTGVVGALTRAKLNKLYGSVNQGSSSGGVDTSSPSTVASRIDSISPSVVTSSPQTMTIYGAGFTPSGNTIVIASDNEKGIGSYSSTDGKTLTFYYTSSLVEKIKSQLARYKGTAQYPAILSSFIQNLTGETISVENGVTYARAIILVKNVNGTSNPVNIKVDIKSLLQ